MSERQVYIAIDAIGGEQSPFKTLKGSEIFQKTNPHTKLIFFGNKKNGEVTSGSQSPSLKKGIGLAFINHPYTKVGTTLEVEIRGQKKSAIIVKPPFYKNGTVNI